MTIETATPTSAETIAALFDNLVDAVAQRVLAQLDERLQGLLDSAEFEDKLEASVQTAVDNLDLDDTIMEAIQNLDFEVRVSR
jgi:uncharacterized membrane protein YheB (UPF0754 family)